MKEAILELQRNNVFINNKITKHEKHESTFIDGEVLYYKSIPQGLMTLVNEERITNNFDTFGVMLDLSRGAVFRVSYIKKLIRSYSMMGINEVWLYLENNYFLENYETFGYFRGRYTDDELKEIVKYAKIFGIEIIPALQVLGHQE